MESSGNTVPEKGKIVGKKRKKRTQAQKVGTNRLILRKVARIESRQERIEQMQRIILQGLSGYFKFDRPIIEKVCCESELDFAVVSAVFESGGGVLTKRIIEVLAARFPQEGLERHKIQRIVNRVNLNCSNAFGPVLIEKRGKRWAFTSFGFEIWGKTKRDLDAENQSASNLSEEELRE